MQHGQDHAASRAGGVLQFAWRALAGMAVVAGALYLGTALVEALLPDPPVPVRAGAAMRPSEIGAEVPRAAEPSWRTGDARPAHLGGSPPEARPERF